MMYLCIQDIVANGNCILFTSHDMAAILKYDMSTEYSEIEAVLPGCCLDDELVVGPIHKVGNMILLAPVHGETMYLYDMKKKCFVSESINESLRELKRNSVSNENEYYGKTQGENCSVFLGKGRPNIAVFRNCMLEVYEYPYKLQRNIKGTFNGYFGSNAGVLYNKIYIPICNTTKISVFDLNRNCFMENYDCGRELIACCSDSKGIWMVPQDKGDLRYLDLSKNRLYSVDNYPDGFSGAEIRWFQSAQYCVNEIIIFPYKSNMLFRMNVDTYKMVCIKRFEDSETIKYTHSGLFDAERVWGFYHPENRLDIVDCYSWDIKSIFIDYPVNTLDVLRKKVLRNNRVLTEKVIQLSDFMRLIKSEVKDNGQIEGAFMSAGEKIWDSVK